MDDRFEENRAMWDERVPIHVAGDFYDVEAFLAGRDPIRPFEPEEMGPVEGLDLVHLQCHFGLDTLGWARRGARVTGLDFSQPAIDEGTRLAGECGIDARFVQADVHDAVAALGATYDVVYTGLGALTWLPDLTRWAEVVRALLRPGGRLYLVEFHPFLDVLPYDVDDIGELRVVSGYFHDPAGEMDETSGTYADLTAETVNNRAWEWRHPLSDVVSAVLGAGLRLEFLHEHDYTLYPRFPFLEHEPGGIYRLPPGAPHLPFMYSLAASRER